MTENLKTLKPGVDEKHSENGILTKSQGSRMPVKRDLEKTTRSKGFGGEKRNRNAFIPGRGVGESSSNRPGE